MIDSCKVDMALILACGMGSRMGELTKDIPKCLFNINGDILIERVIRQLKEKGINDIYVMTGYLHEKLDYLKDKYDVKLVYNDEYETKNTIGTIYHAKDIIKNKNVYICVADVYIKDNLFNEYEKRPYYLGVKKRDCSLEWTYIVDSEDKILAIQEGVLDDYCMIGFSFHTKEMINKLLLLVEKYYSMEGTSDYYWEDVLIRNFDKLPDIYIRRIEYGIVFEFDNESDIKSCEIYNNALKFYKKTFGIIDATQLSIEEMGGGLTNTSFKVKYNDKQYILRIPAENMGRLIDRKAEVEIYSALSKYDISDKVENIDVTGYKISELFNVIKQVNINDSDDLKKCMECYRKLHSLDINVENNIDIANVLLRYFDIVEKENIKIDLTDFTENVSHCKKIISELNNMKRPKTLCHGDPSPYNVLFTDKGTKLIDFEYAGMADPISDIALFGVYVEFDLESTYKLYDYYKSYNDVKLKDGILLDDNDAYELIHKYMIVSSMASTYWGIIREHQTGDSFYDYYIKKYEMYRNLINL